MDVGGVTLEGRSGGGGGGMAANRDFVIAGLAVAESGVLAGKTFAMGERG